MHDETLIPVARPDLAISLANRAMFWQPRHAGGVGSMLHVPFLFWLVETCRPTRIVQIGIAEPARFLSLCQAAEKLGMESLCIGVDDSAEGNMLDSAQTDQHATLYGDFSFIAKESLTEAVHHVQGQPIDLLVIDRPLNDEHVGALQTHWAPLLSPHALVIVHDPENMLQETAAGRYVAELSKDKLVIAFPQAKPGLQLILLGDEQPDDLRQLAALKLGMPGYLLAQQMFMRLGQGLESAQELRRSHDTIKMYTLSLDALQNRLSEVEETLEQEKSERSAILASEEQQIVRVAELQATLFDLQMRLQEMSSNTHPAEEMAALQAALVQAQQDRQAILQKYEAQKRHFKENEIKWKSELSTEAERYAKLSSTIDLLQNEISALVDERDSILSDKSTELLAATKQSDDLLIALTAAQASIAEMEVQYMQVKTQLLEQQEANAAIAIAREGEFGVIDAE